MDTVDKLMDSVLLEGPAENTLTFGKTDIPEPRKGQVLIKVESVPINPTDVYMMQGKYAKYANFKYPHTPGFEGSGTVIRTGGGILGWRVKNKRVAFTRMDQRRDKDHQITIGGTMAQYCVTNAYQCIPLDDDVTFDQGCTYFINPITALGLIETVKEGKAEAIVITAAFSQLGKMLLRLCDENNIKTITTVRKSEQVEILEKEYGATY